MDFTPMRDYSEFCEQLNEIRVRFHKWDSCEQTVALYYLMVGLPYANAKFLHHALEQCIASAITPESQVQERNANDPKFISNLLSERPPVILSMLLSHIPLLKPGNKEISDCYLRVIRKVLAEFISPPCKIYNECIEIMSYVFVHPAFGKEDKKSFKHLLKQVVTKVTPENFVHSPVNESSDESVSPNPEPVGVTVSKDQSNRLNRRSNSLTPAQTSSSRETLSPGPEIWSSQENLSQQTTKPRSYSLSNDKSINLHSTLQSSSSETRLQDLQTMNNQPIMKSIVSWLKSLRLHKYSWVFNNLTYDQMLNLTEESLQAIGITKGARHKLLLSIAKLKERSVMLTLLETEVMNGADLLNALKKLKSVLQSPLQVCNGEDLPSQFVKVMGKVCTQLLMLRQPSDECLVLFSTLCERAETCDSFTAEQKRRLALWRGQLTRGHSSNSYNHGQSTGSNNYHNRHSTHAAPYPVPLPTMIQPKAQQHYSNHSKSSSYPNMQNNQNAATHRHSIGSITINNLLQSIQLQSNASLTNSFKKEFSTTPSVAVAAAAAAVASSVVSNSKVTTTTMSAAAMNVPPVPLGVTTHHHVRFQDSEIDRKGKRPPQILKSVDIESSLESLCLQMMEHALGP